MLAIELVGRSKVMRCRGCGGCWVQKERIGAVLGSCMELLAERSNEMQKLGDRINPFQIKEASLPCPECGRPMRKLNYAYNSNVIIDECKSCRGIWFEKGELRKVAEFFKYCGLPKSMKESFERIKAIYDRHGEGGEDVRDDFDDLGDMLYGILDPDHVGGGGFAGASRGPLWKKVAAVLVIVALLVVVAILDYRSEESTCKTPAEIVQEYKEKWERGEISEEMYDSILRGLYGILDVEDKVPFEEWKKAIEAEAAGGR
jgi:Zn-finger nucleic acid-binding protein